MKQITWLAMAWFACAFSAHAASFDCTKAKAYVEKTICENTKLSQLDEELSESYKNSLQDKSAERGIREEQRRWLQEVGQCTEVECVERLYLVRVVKLQNQSARSSLTRPFSVDKIARDRLAGVKGEYFLTKSEDLICDQFTKNLNEFRNIDFDKCHPRLSEKYQDFSRPEWKTVPLDLEIAELAFKGAGGSRLNPGEGIYWQNWLKETMDLRMAGKVEMWLTKVDINNDGIIDSIARVQYANPASDLPVKKRGCTYSQSGLWKLSPNSAALHDGRLNFYFGADSDIIHYAKTGRAYSVAYSQVAFDPDLWGQKIGATRAVIVELSREARSSPIPVCYINWVPTGSYRPLELKVN